MSLRELLSPSLSSSAHSAGLRCSFSSALMALFVLCLGAVLAPSAHAATTIEVTCTESSITLYGTAGDEFEFMSAGVCSDYWEINNTNDRSVNDPGWLEYRANTNMDVSSGAVNAPTDWWYAYFQNPRPSSATVRLMATNSLGSPLTSGTTIAGFDNDMDPNWPTSGIIIPIIYGGVSQAAATDPDTAWTVIRQSIPLPSDGDCAAISDAGHAWGTGLTGGWVKSWEPWVDAGNGGWACNRTLVNKSGAAWIIDNAA